MSMIRITLSIICEIDGDLSAEKAGDYYAGKIPGCLLSDEEGGNDEWALLTQSVEVKSCKSVK